MDETNNIEKRYSVLLTALKKNTSISEIRMSDYYLNEIVSNERSESCFIFNIHDFRKCCEQNVRLIESETLEMEDPNIGWKLKVYLKQNPNSDFLSLYLKPCFLNPCKVQANIKVSILDNQNKPFKTWISGSKIFNKDSLSFGWPQFVEINYLLEEHSKEQDNILEGDKLSILCTIKTSKITNYTSKRLNFDMILNSPPKKKVPLAENTENTVNNTWKHLYNDKFFSDVTLVIGNQEIKAHKGVLASASQVFLENLKKEEPKTDCIEIMDISYEVINEMLRFVYTNQVENLHNIAHELIMAASKYMIDDLKTVCELALCKNINFDNIEKIVSIADDCHAEMLMKSAVDFIIKNKEELKNNPEYENIIFCRQSFARLVMKSLM